jgi:hypothetical protein
MAEEPAVPTPGMADSPTEAPSIGVSRKMEVRTKSVTVLPVSMVGPTQAACACSE